MPKQDGCPLHPSCLTCPEPVCIYDFPGGINALLRFKEMRAALERGKDVNDVAEELSIHLSTARRRFNKVAGR